MQKKRSRHKDVVEVEQADEGEGKVIDLMEVLKKSLTGKQRTKAASSSR